MPKGVYYRSPELLEKLTKQITRINKERVHGEDCKCASCLGKKGSYRGKNNPRYKHGKDIDWYKYHKEAREKKHLLPQECSRCGETNDLRIHHKDHNFTNNELSNLEHICRSCHRKEHPRKKRLAEQRPCACCGKMNWYYPTRLNRNKRFFCNKECYRRWQRSLAE